MENKKYIIREVEPESCDFSFYFDNDGLTSAAGDYCYNLFIISYDGWGRCSGFNMDEYKKVVDEAENLIDAFDRVGGGPYDFISFKEAMQYVGCIPYSPRMCHALKEWWKHEPNVREAESIADYLTIKTGKQWAVSSARGYCQGDYVELVYCKDFYADGVEKYGEVWLGAAKEFCVIDLDENGEEADSCYGYIVANCEAWQDEEYKKIVCEWACIPEAETQLEMIDGSHTYTKYDYRIA
jgi:hypothetical protein